MAEGLPISLLVTDEVRAGAARIDTVFSSADPEAAWRHAREEGIDFLFIGRIEREAFPGTADQVRSPSRPVSPVFCES